MSMIESGRHEYRIDLASKKIEKQLDNIPDKFYNKISQKINSLALNPRPFGCQKLSEKVYRIKVGKYRIIYSIFDKEKLIVVDKVDRRKERTYKNI